MTNLSPLTWMALSALALGVAPSGVVAGSVVDLFVDLRPGNPCQQFTDLQAAIDQAGREPSESRKVIHLVGGSILAGQAFRIRDVQNIEIIADVADTAGTCTILPQSFLPPPAKLNGAGLVNRRTLEIDAISDSGAPGSVHIENVEFLNNINQGAVSVADSTLTLRDVTFRGNTARVNGTGEGGGAIVVIENDRQAFLRLLGGVAFYGNRAVVAEGSGVNSAHGGAVLCSGGAVITAPPLPIGVAATFGDGTEEGANEAEGFGGAVSAIDCGIDLDDTSFHHNVARDGGGGIFLYERRDLRVFIDSSHFVGNRQLSDDGGGGGVMIVGESRRGEGAVEITSSSFVGNQSAGAGGGAVLMQVLTGSDDDAHSTTLRFVDSSFVQNEANGPEGEGGAVYVINESGPASTMRAMCEDASGSRELPQDRYCMEFIGNVATKNGAAVRIRGDLKSGSGLHTAALRHNHLTSPGPDAGSAISIVRNNDEGIFSIMQTLMEGPADATDGPVLLAFHGADEEVFATFTIQRSTLRHGAAILSTDQDVSIANSLLISPDLSGLPAPGEGFKCSLAVEDKAFPGLNLRETERGELRISETSILRQHSEALFQPCSDQVRNGQPTTDFDLDGHPRPEQLDDADPYDIGAFEFFAPDDSIFYDGYELTPQS